MIPLLDIDI